jgi:hypothetical protein
LEIVRSTGWMSEIDVDLVLFLLRIFGQER